MVGIKHHRQVTEAESLDEAVEIDYSEWNEAHDKGNVADVLTDHTKAVHDALGLDHGSLSNVTASQHHAKYTDAEALAASIVKSLNPTWTDNYIMVYKSTPDEWQMEAKPSGGVSDHGDLTGLDDSADHTWAFLVDGSRAMTGNADLASYALLTTNLGLKEIDSEYLGVRNRALDAYKSLHVNKFWSGGACGFGVVPDAGVAYHRRFAYFKDESNNYWSTSFEYKRTNSVIDMTFANVGDLDYGGVSGIGADVVMQLNAYVSATENALRNCIRFGARWKAEDDGWKDATRTSIFNIAGCDGGSSVDTIFKIIGKQVTIPDLAGSGDAYVYVDSNGNLKRGGSYP